ncbi:hypothetical protein TcCL_ESM05892 [Trypanosoma cruzi]|nr:hypothetical protein TcCL_ESM05892 [Trypanosoma cruzi]
MTLRNPTQRDSGHCCRHGAIPPAKLRQCLARGLPHRSQATVVEGFPRGKGRCAHRTAGACQSGEGSVPGVRPDILPRAAAPHTGATGLLPALRQACARPAGHNWPSVSVAPSLTHCGGRPASAPAGTPSRPAAERARPSTI